MTNSSTDMNDTLRRWATYASLGVALTLIAAKLVAYIATNSVAVLSSLIDSTVDVLASIVTLCGVASALKPPDTKHRYGYGKAEPLAALTQGAFIVGSSVLLGYEALHRLLEPSRPEALDIGYGVMGLATVLTLGLVAFQNYVVRRTGSMAISADSLHYRGDLLTNLAVIMALVLGDVTGSGLFDPLFAMGVAGILIFGALRIARDALRVLLDRELPEATRARIRTLVHTHPQVRGLHDLRTRSDGERHFIEFHLELDGHITLTAAHDIADAVEQHLLMEFAPAEISIHQEPAGLDDKRLDHRVEK
ncbi:MAG: cation diffusion facilitator family transporter [Alphaproteobacteria bacterium]